MCLIVGVDECCGDLSCPVERLGEVGARLGVDVIESVFELGDESTDVLEADLLDGEVVAASVGGFEQVVDFVHHGAPLIAVGDADFDGGLVGDVEGDVHAVADLQAQLMAARFEIDDAVGLAASEMHVIGVAHDRLAFGQATGIGDDVEVAGTTVDFAGLFDGDTVSGHRQLDAAGDGGAIYRRGEDDGRFGFIAVTDVDVIDTDGGCRACPHRYVDARRRRGSGTADGSLRLRHGGERGEQQR